MSVPMPTAIEACAPRSKSRMATAQATAHSAGAREDDEIGTCDEEGVRHERDRRADEHRDAREALALLLAVGETVGGARPAPG